MARRGLSRKAAALATASALLAAGCASGPSQEEQVQVLRARSAYEQGLRQMQDKRVALALSALKEAVALDPESAAYRNALGVILFETGRFGDAQVQLEKAMELDPTFAEAIHNLGLAHAQQGRFEEAIAYYRRALSEPTYTSPHLAYHNLGNAYFALGRLGEAEEAYRTAIRLNGDPFTNISSYFGLGSTLVRAGRKEEAKAAFRAARDLDPSSPFHQPAAQALKALEEGG